MNARLLLLAPVVLAVVAVVSGCAGYVPGRQSNWDNKISELCEKEGTVQIFSQVVLTTKEASFMPHVEGKLATRPRSASGADPVYSERTVAYLREADPRVTREEVVVVRRNDQTIVAKWVEYARVGGDLPTGLVHESSFRCPDPRARLNELQRLFVVKG